MNAFMKENICLYSLR